MNWINLIFIVVGFLVILVYPKIIRWMIFLLISYLTIFMDLYYAILYIPYLGLLWYYRRKGGN